MAALLFVALQLKLFFDFEIVYEQVFKEIFTVFCSGKSLLVGRVVDEGSELWQVLPINGEDDQVIVVSELLVIEKSNVRIKLALLTLATLGPSRPSAQHKLLLAEHAIVLIVVVCFDDSYLVLGNVGSGGHVVAAFFKVRATLLIGYLEP